MAAPWRDKQGGACPPQLFPKRRGTTARNGADFKENYTLTDKNSKKIKKEKAERPGLEPGRHLRVDRLAICSVTTPAPLLYFQRPNPITIGEKADANVLLHTLERNYFYIFLCEL